MNNVTFREACLQAADHIQARSHLYDFSYGGAPRDCDSGCALARVAGMLGLGIFGTHEDAAQLMGLKPELTSPMYGRGVPHKTHAFAFYNRMCELLGTAEWMNNAALAAKGLRLFAESKHCPADKPPERVESSPATLAWYGFDVAVKEVIAVPAPERRVRPVTIPSAADLYARITTLGWGVPVTDFRRVAGISTVHHDEEREHAAA